jgi:hypothetical protein
VNPWDLVTWVAVVLLGPGAVVVFAAFVRDLLRMRRRARDGDGGASPDPPA